MSVQLVIIHVILFTFIFLFLLLAYIEYGLGPIKLRARDIKNLQDRTKHRINNTYFTNIINITKSDYEDLWDVRADCWLHNWGKPRPPTQIDTPLINRDTEIANNIHQLQNSQQEIHSQPPKNLEFPISKQKITGIHQVQTSLNGAITTPYCRNHNIPQSAIKIFTNGTNHNKVHKRSRRIIDKN